MADKDIKRIIADSFMELADVLETGRKPGSPIALTALGSELGEAELYAAAKAAADRGVGVKLIGKTPLDYPGIEVVSVEDEEAGHKKLEELLENGTAGGGVTMHYPFPIGVSTVGRVITPGKGKPLYIATTTGTSALNRVEGLVKNAIYGIAAAKACGVTEPTIGLLNLDGARQAETILKGLQADGYDFKFAESARSDGGAVMRGNDLLTASCDVMVTDPLTGNILMKLFSSFTTGGSYESVGYGYGPGMGEGMDKLILIVSRASGAPVVSNAIIFADELVRGNWQKVFADEWAAANKAGLEAALKAISAPKQAEAATEEIVCPPKEVCTEEIHGVEILDLEDAVQALWKAGIYAESGMGCTGPVVMIAETSLAKAKEELADKGYIGA